MKFLRKIEENPLKTIWNIISSIVGVFGMISLFEDYITWKNSIPELIEIYQLIIYFPFRYFEIHINPKIIDYLFIGSLCASSFIKAIDYGEKKGLLNTRGNPIIARVFYFIIYLIAWPLALVIAIKQVLFGFKDLGEVEMKKSFSNGYLLYFFFF